MNAAIQETPTPGSSPVSRPVVFAPVDEGEKKESNYLPPLIGVVGGLATLAAFLANYGLMAIGLVVFIYAIYTATSFSLNESFLAYSERKYPKTYRTLVWVVLIVMCVAGFAFAVVGFNTSYSTIDWFRPDIGAKPLKKNTYRGSTAPWHTLPPSGASAEIEREFKLNGFKRLMVSAVVNDPQNRNQAVRQFFYVETDTFDRSYKSFDAELEFPTSVEISEAFAFLTREASSRSSYGVLEVLRTTYPTGVDRNLAEVFVNSPNGGERLVLFVVASTKNSRPFPKDIVNNIGLRSIK